MKKLTIGILVAMSVAAMAVAGSLESKYSATGALTFGPGEGQSTVRSLMAHSGSAAGTVTVAARSGNKYKVVSWTSATNAVIANASFGLTNSDAVVVVAGDGALTKTTISTSSTNGVTLAGTASTNGTCYIYEMGTLAVVDVPLVTGTGFSNAVLNLAADVNLASPGDSPMTFVLTGSTTTNLTVTLDK